MPRCWISISKARWRGFLADLENNQTTIDKKQLEKAPCNFFIWFQGLGKWLKMDLCFPAVSRTVCLHACVFLRWLCHSVLSTDITQCSNAVSEVWRIPNKEAPAKTQGKKNKWHTVDIPDAPCMDYLLTLGERCPHSRGNVGTYFLHGAFGYDI